ncbi:hypothetical protein MBRA1_000176 [Malassezia brasiliensis]|uniref:NADH-ubiquinone oxidoreductase 12 kDa subunit n=1 Tax=Malassezia brasiliensis TaxID=1821822 RepID=A0AAF0INB3_9BASI|nr:hypothetical protein MBRA1_000176 [Malassezia brasiliensis]
MSVSVTPESTAANQERKAESIRDEWIKVMQLRLVRDELQKCHRAEGENHYQVCAPIVKVYNDLLKEARVKGYRTVDV